MRDEDSSRGETQTSGGMGSGGRIAIVAALVIVVAAVFWMKNRAGDRNLGVPPDGSEAQVAVAAGAQGTRPSQPGVATSSTANEKLPRLVDLGANKCIPCKQMAPILEKLRKDFAGRLEVEFIDVWQNPHAGELYKVKMIPTQIFYDASEKELYRHEGFFSREDILAKWKELGVDLKESK